VQQVTEHLDPPWSAGLDLIGVVEQVELAGDGHMMLGRTRSVRASPTR
jgi:hypothetical protein